MATWTKMILFNDQEPFCTNSIMWHIPMYPIHRSAFPGLREDVHFNILDMKYKVIIVILHKIVRCNSLSSLDKLFLLL